MTDTTTARDATSIEILRHRTAPIDMDATQFRELGHRLVDRIANELATIATRRVAPDRTPAQVRAALGDHALPSGPTDPAHLLAKATDALFENSLFNGHPRFFGYITSSAAPIGILGDLLASAVNPNVGAWTLSPMATEVEAEAVRWIAELIGFPADGGGLLVSGGNMANFVCFLAARRAKVPWDVRRTGLRAADRQLRVYASKETHTWLQKAADIFGLGTDAIRWIPTDAEQRLDPDALVRSIDADRADGDLPFLVVGTAGSVSTGAVDPLAEIGAICRRYDLWFHVDGAYGALAAGVPGAPPALDALAEADSVAVDPHKWLYAPLEAGCALVRQRDALRDAFSYHPPYYHFSEEVTNYFDSGLQNSRGFRALKVWLALKQVGRDGCRQMIADDIRLAGHLYRLMEQHPEIEPRTNGLSITTFRYVPADLAARTDEPAVGTYLDLLNQELLGRVERSGEAFFSNAVIQGTYALRICIVNFRTSLEDVEAMPALVARQGREADRALRSENLSARPADDPPPSAPIP